MFVETIDKLNNVITSKYGEDRLLVDDYDAVLVKEMKASNLLGARDNTHQSHIALTGKAIDMFPYVDIMSYTYDRNTSMKSFYILKVPVYIGKKNTEALKRDIHNPMNIELEHNKTRVEISVKQSLRNDGSKQLEVANTTTSDDLFRKFRLLIQENDMLVLLKKKAKVEYEVYIIRSRDVGDLKNTIEFNASRNTSTLVSVDSYKEVNMEESNEVSVEESNYGDVIHNKIYYGAPGTGKSYGVSEEIKSMYPDYIEEEPAEYVVRTSLHPEYTYSDFVGQVMPVKNGEDITYDFKPGVFTNALKKAIELPSRVVYLVLEELSRANVAAVFGDLFQLLDRNDYGISQYKISNPIIAKEIHGNNCENDDIRLPANLLIRGTVNTNDQNVFVMDTAFKRRFEWEYVSTDPVTGANGEFLNNPEIEYERGSRLSWCDFYQAVNDYITREMELGEDKQIGQFFIKFADQDYSERNQTLIQNKLLQYLWEDVDKASFNARLFSSSIKNFSTLYKMFESGERVFSTLFLNSLGTPNSNTTPTEADTSEAKGESNAEAEE